MIEVENRFLLMEESKKKLTEGAEFLGKKTFTDIYYYDAEASIEGDFVIAFDVTDLGFSVGEIELTVNSEPETEAASRRLIDFAREQSIEIVATEGKVLECLKISRPELYQFIKEAGVV